MIQIVFLGTDMRYADLLPGDMLVSTFSASTIAYLIVGTTIEDDRVTNEVVLLWGNNFFFTRLSRTWMYSTDMTLFGCDRVYRDGIEMTRPRWARTPP